MFEAVEVVAGMLAGQVMVARIEQDAVFTAGVIHDAAAKLVAVAGVHDEGAHRVGAEIDSDGERGHARSLCKGSPAM